MNHFSEDLVDFKAGGKGGSISCPYCLMDGKPNALNVFLKQTQNDIKSYWVMSYFSKHLKQNHTNHVQTITQEKIIEKLDETEISSSKSLQNLKVVSMDIESWIEYLPVEDKDVDSPDSNLYEMDEIKNDPDNLIFMQLSTQYVLMAETVLKYNSKEMKMCFETTEDTHEIGVLKVKGDGSCLFRTIVHQLDRVKISSYQLEQSTRKLRKDVVIVVTVLT